MISNERMGRQAWRSALAVAALVGVAAAQSADGSTGQIVPRDGATSQAATLLAEQQLFATDGGTGHLYGKSLAVRGDTLLVGAPHSSGFGVANGRAYAYTRTSGGWAFQQQLVPAAGPFIQEGQAVDVDGNVAALAGLNVAHVFERAGGVWSQTATLVPAAATGFGHDLALSGDTLAVGGHDFDDSVWVYGRDAGAWVLQDEVRMVPAENGLGKSLGLDGDRLLAASPLASSVHSFVRDAGAWVLEGTIPVAAGEQLAEPDVALSGATAVVAVRLELTDPPSVQLGARVYTWDGTQWICEQLLGPVPGSSVQVAIDGGTIVLAVQYGDDETPGEAHVFVDEGGSWVWQQTAVASTGDPAFSFGESVAVDADTIVVGAQVADGVTPLTGAAYVYEPLPSWTDLGHALAGTLGEPALVGSGDLAPWAPFELLLGNVPPFAPCWLIAGLGELLAPFKAGVLVPTPDLIIGPIPADGAGTIPVAELWAPGLPIGTSVVFQYWLPDAGGPKGLAASNAVSGLQTR